MFVMQKKGRHKIQILRYQSGSYKNHKTLCFNKPELRSLGEQNECVRRRFFFIKSEKKILVFCHIIDFRVNDLFLIQHFRAKLV